VFTSNFFEHLPSKRALQATVLEAYRCLRPNGYLIALGPNVKHLSGSYWDFFDHHLPLTERSVAEALIMAAFRIEQRIEKFLPYTMSQGLQPPIWTLNLYLKMPFVWKIFGKQFLVIGRK
jgi:SAM-dependent methyltransferase